MMTRRVSLESRTAFWLMVPVLLGLSLFSLLPSLALLPIAASAWQLGTGSAHWIGPRNFLLLLRDPYFAAAVVHTLIYCAVVAPLSLIAGLVAALLIDGTRTLRHIYRGVLFLPTIATMTAMAIAWEALLNPTVGLVNIALAVLGIAGPNWLQNESTVFPTLMVLGVWQNFGLAMVFFLAGLRTIPRELYDAAAMDGIHGPLDTLRYVTWPLLAPVTLFVLILTAERAFSLFDTVQVLTQGGPGRTSEVLMHLMFVEGIERLRMGYGAAIAIVYLALIGSLVLLQRRLLESRIHYQ